MLLGGPDLQRRHRGHHKNPNVIRVLLVCLLVLFFEGFYNVYSRLVNTTVNNNNNPLSSKQHLLVTRVLILNQDNSVQCAETINSCFKNASFPSLIRISVFEELPSYSASCRTLYCKKYGKSSSYCSHVSSQRIHSSAFKSTSTSLYNLEQMINKPHATDMCIKIDSQVQMTRRWETSIYSDYKKLCDNKNNNNVIISTSPRSINTHSSNYLQLCAAHMEIAAPNNTSLVVFNPPVERKKRKQSAQLSLDFYYTACTNLQVVPHDPLLWDIDDKFIPFSRSIRYFTHGYKFYPPSSDYLHQSYTKRKDRHSHSASSSSIARLVSLMKDSPTDIYTTLGTTLSREQYQEFSKINIIKPGKYDPNRIVQYNQC